MSFKKEDSKTYSKYKDILIGFQKYYTLYEFNLKEIDNYLWQAGKNYFSKKYWINGKKQK